MTSDWLPAQHFHSPPEVNTRSALRLSRNRISLTSRLAIVRVMASESRAGSETLMFLKFADWLAHRVCGPLSVRANHWRPSCQVEQPGQSLAAANGLRWIGGVSDVSGAIFVSVNVLPDFTRPIKP